MKVEVRGEAGYEWALEGLSLSYEQPMGRMPAVSNVLYSMEGGHNKFLESIVLWLSIDAPRYWWQQFDTYRVGVTKQSESTMHTVVKRQLTQDDFQDPIHLEHLYYLNYLIDNGMWKRLKNDLPEGFLQRRIVVLNYKVVRRIIHQRMDHKLTEWQEFIHQLVAQLEHPEFINDIVEEVSMA